MSATPNLKNCQIFADHQILAKLLSCLGGEFD